MTIREENVQLKQRNKDCVILIMLMFAVWPLSLYAVATDPGRNAEQYRLLGQGCEGTQDIVLGVHEDEMPRCASIVSLDRRS